MHMKMYVQIVPFQKEGKLLEELKKKKLLKIFQKKWILEFHL